MEQHLIKTEAMTLKDRKRGYMEGFGGRKIEGK